MIHKEAKATLILSAILFAIIAYLCHTYCDSSLFLITTTILVLLYLFLISFFRNPTRNIPELDNKKIYAPADGKIVVIENAYEAEYFKEERLQLSIFMSPLNVHVNRSPLDGQVIYKKHHNGKYLAAWNPKSSTENERCTIVLDSNGNQILVKQIAGALARRIMNYASEGKDYKQGEEFGFIKFGSRVDLFLPLGTNVNVAIDDMVRGNLDVIAELN